MGWRETEQTIRSRQRGERGKAQEGDAVTRAGRSRQGLPARTRIQGPPPAGGHNSQAQAKPKSPQNQGPGGRLSAHWVSTRAGANHTREGL